MSSNWLTQLSPGHAPPAPGWWSLAPGWWLLVLLVVVGAAWIWWWRRPRSQHRRAALRELKQIATSRADTAATARAIENLLRRYAIALFGVESVGKLSGAAWLRFVGSHGGERLAGDTGRSLLLSAFGGVGADERERWLADAAAFVNRAPRRWRATR